MFLRNTWLIRDMKIHLITVVLLCFCFACVCKGESRLIRLQFDGSSRAEAAEVCRKAVERLQDYVPVQEHLTTPASAAPSDPAEPGPSTQQQVGNTRLIFHPSSQKMFVNIQGNYGVIMVCTVGTTRAGCSGKSK